MYFLFLFKYKYYDTNNVGFKRYKKTAKPIRIFVLILCDMERVQHVDQFNLWGGKFLLSLNNKYQMYLFLS